MLKKIKGVFETVILTKMHYEKAVEPQKLKEECLKLGVKVVVEHDVIKAVRLAERIIVKKGVVVVFGSLYFTGEVRRFFKNKNKILKNYI